MVDDLTIKTGVDRLIDFVDSKKEVKISDASKALGVSSGVIEEWADFLEEKGVLTIKYKFTVPYLVKKQATSPEIEKEIKAVKGQRDTVLQKADSMVTSLSNDSQLFMRFRKDFESLLSEISGSQTLIRTHLDQLEAVKAYKSTLDSMQKTGDFKVSGKWEKAKAEIESAGKQLTAEINAIRAERANLKEELEKARKLEAAENSLHDRLEQMLDEQRKLASLIAEHGTKSAKTAAKLQQSMGSLDSVLKVYEFRAKDTEGLIKEANVERDRLKDMEDKLAGQMGGLQQVKQLSPRAKGTFVVSEQLLSRKKELEQSMKDTSVELNELLREIRGILTELNILKSLQKGQDLDKSMSAIEGKLLALETKRERFHKHVGKVMGFFHHG